MGDLLDSVFPELLHLVSIGDIVILTLASARPLARRAACHGFAVRAADIDAVTLCSLTVAVGEEERLGALVHGWPISVGAEAEHEFEDA